MAKTVTIYGIKNCDTMKKARAWLDHRGVEYGFHDYKSAGVERDTLERWARATGWERHHVPQATGQGQGRAHGEEGHRADACAAVDDQASGARYRRQADGGIQSGGLRQGVRPLNNIGRHSGARPTGQVQNPETRPTRAPRRAAVSTLARPLSSPSPPSPSRPSACRKACTLWLYMLHNSRFYISSGRRDPTHV